MNIIKISILLSILVLIQHYTFAQIPSGYYKLAEEKKGSDLKAALNSIIDEHHMISYGDARYILEKTDASLQSKDSLRTIYTYHRSLAEWDAGNTWNREHVWSKSKGFEIDDLTNSYKGVGSDIHNLRACIPSINSAKNNRWFAPATEIYYYNDTDTGSKTITGGNDTDWVWEPRDEDKGDVARILFYMATRYEGENNEVDLELLDYIPNDAHSNDPIYAKLSHLLEWHENDPVDDFEKQRNNIIYQSQENRNPFIDHPEFAFPIFCVSISDLETIPNKPGPEDDVHIKATINSQIDLSEIEVHWGTTEFSLETSITMVSSTNGYQTISTIPAQPSGSVYYQVEATDLEGTAYLSDVEKYTINEYKIFEEDFERVDPDENVALSDWTNLSKNGERLWVGKSYGGNKYAQFSSYNSDEENECWLISPKIAENEPQYYDITFDINVGYWKHHGLEVFYSIDFTEQAIETANWVNISNSFYFPTEPTDGYGEFQAAGLHQLVLESDQGFHLAFVYKGNSNDETSTYQIDNVEVKIGLTSIQNSTSSIKLYPNPAHDVLQIRNLFTSTSISVFNHMGQKQNCVLNDFGSLDIKNLHPGLYCLTIYDKAKKQKQSHWFIKQ